MGTLSDRDEKLSLALLNINGLRNKTDEIRYIIKKHRLHVFALCETKLDSSVKDSQVYIEGFRMWRKDRTNKGGGVALYVQDHIKTKLRLDLIQTEVEMIWVEMKLHDRNPVLLGCCYRAPDNLKDLVQIHDIMMQVSKEKERKDIMLMGDLNVDQDEKDGRKNVADYYSSKWGLTQIVTEKTRHAEKSSSCIDHIYTNIQDLSTKSTAKGCSDHNVVTVTVENINVPQWNTNIRSGQFNPDEFKTEIQNTPWTDVNSEKDPEKALSKFTKIYLSVADKHAPLEIQNIYDLLRLDENLESLISKRDEIKQNTQDKMRNSAEPNQLNNNLDDGNRINCFECKGEKCENCKLIEGHMTQIEKEKKEKKEKGESLPSHVINIRGERDVTSDLYYLKLEDHWNGHHSATFSFSTMQGNIEKEWLTKPFKLVTEELNTDDELLNLSATRISGPIRHILNLCIQKPVFPSELKQFELIPFSTNTITKLRLDRSNDRLHVMIGFVFDIFLCSQVQQYFINKKLIPSESLNDEIKKLEKAWETAIEKQQTVTAVFLDFSSSFDTISHDLLIKKLEVSGFSPEALSLIKSFLSYDEGSHGLPRGSFLARLLFTFFINDLKSELKSSTAVICQNHMIVYVARKIPGSLEKKSNDGLEKVSEWAQKNKLTYIRYTNKNQIISTKPQISKLLNSLLDCNQFTFNWIQQLRETTV